jgi:hypothetical protein
MAAKKKDPAALRTIGLFTGKTVIEEAEAMAREEEQPERADVPRDLPAEAEECAVRWLGLDAFHDHGDDIKVAVHSSGHAVMVLVRADVKGAPRGVITIKLSRSQWAKLKAIVTQA